MATVVLKARPAKRVRAGDRELSVAVRESARARTMRILVGPRRALEIIVPEGTPDTTIEAFLTKKSGWIGRKVEASEEIAARPPKLGLQGRLWLEGKPLTIETAAGRRAHAELCDGVLRVSGDADAAAGAIERWYRREARRRLTEVVEREARRLHLGYASVAVRDQKTRWGSCSAKGNLSFNWRLILCPPEVLEYVVVHELLHLREPNHSKAFWRLLETARPGWQEQARWLREHGQELHDYEL